MTPTRIAKVGDKSLRFYLSPLDGPDFPWVDFDDVAALARLPAEYVTEIKNHWASVYPTMARHLPSGATIVPDSCARGLFHWTGEWGWQPSEAAGRLYEQAAAEVLVSLYGNLPATIFQDFLQKASLRSQPAEMGRAH